MKQYLLLALLVLFAGCAGDGSDSSAKDSTKKADSIARQQVVPSGDTIAHQSDSTPTIVTGDTTAPNLFRALFRVFYTTTYCGGARPTEEITEQHATPRLLTTSTLKLKNHHTGVVYTLLTDLKGEASVEMEEGKYDVYLTSQINSTLPTGFDAKCKQWMQKSLFTVKVTNDGKMRDLTINFECNPCDENMKRRQ